MYGENQIQTNSGFAAGNLWHDCDKTTLVGFNSIGGNKYHNNLQPYMAVYIWHRTA